jgi:hypothetical protein
MSSERAIVLAETWDDLSKRGLVIEWPKYALFPV